MALNLNNLTAKIGTTMPTAQRGRTAEPVPQSIVDAVKQTFTLPEGQGGSFTIPNGDKTENGKDSNVVQIVGQIRKAATQLGYGVSVKVMEPKAKTTEVLFKAKTKSARTRRTKDEIRRDTLIAEWVSNGATEYDGAEDDEVALDAWEQYLALPEDDSATA